MRVFDTSLIDRLLPLLSSCFIVTGKLWETVWLGGWLVACWWLAGVTWVAGLVTRWLAGLVVMVAVVCVGACGDRCGGSGYVLVVVLLCGGVSPHLIQSSFPKLLFLLPVCF